jgi:hypothetical protein
MENNTPEEKKFLETNISQERKIKEFIYTRRKKVYGNTKHKNKASIAKQIIPDKGRF